MTFRGKSYIKRAIEINVIYDKYIEKGLSNREIWRRFIYPRYGVCERTFYNIINVAIDNKTQLKNE